MVPFTVTKLVAVREMRYGTRQKGVDSRGTSSVSFCRHPCQRTSQSQIQDCSQRHLCFPRLTIEFLVSLNFLMQASMSSMSLWSRRPALVTTMSAGARALRSMFFKDLICFDFLK